MPELCVTTAVKLAQDVMRTPGADKVVEKLLPQDMLKRLQSDEPPIEDQ